MSSLIDPATPGGGRFEPQDRDDRIRLLGDALAMGEQAGIVVRIVFDGCDPAWA